MATRPTNAAPSEDVDVQLLKTQHHPQYNRQQSQCTYCGVRHHAQQKCPFTGAQCHKCGCQNHFARVYCSGTQTSHQKINEIHSEEELLVATIEDGLPRTDWSATVKDWSAINAHPDTELTIGFNDVYHRVDPVGGFLDTLNDIQAFHPF